jgi:hypothetical protein
MKSARAEMRRRSAAAAVLICALVASLVVAVGAAVADEGDSAPIRSLSQGGISFPDIQGPTTPEEYPFQLEDPGPEITLRQVDDQRIVAEYLEGGYQAFTFEAESAHAADGATVPTSIRLSEDAEGPVVTEIVRHRAGNPAAGGSPFVYPISGGKGWEGGFSTVGFEMNEPAPAAPSPPAVVPPVICTVPTLHDLPLKAAKARLRAANCHIGGVHLAAHTKAAKGRVVKQFRPVGTELAAGARVAVKLGPR